MNNNNNKDDFDKSIEYYNKILNSNNAKLMEELATLYKNAFCDDIGDYFTFQDRSLCLLEKAVECTTDTKILIKAGDTKRYGTDYDGKYPKKALELYTKAAEMEDGEAMLKIASMYENEFKDESNHIRTALSWIRKAIKINYPHAFYKLGLYYEKGIGVKQDSDKAYELWKKGEEKGDDSCICALHPYINYY